ncbi:MAG: ornithine cyclodeaminase family protein [Actinomycetota bacterium]
MLILTRAEVEELLDPDELIEALAPAMVDLSAGVASMPPRVGAMVPDRDGMLGAMPAWLPAAGVLETKLVSVFPQNAGGHLPTHQALIVAFDPETGSPAALLDGTAITAQRTAAGSALATRLLARPDAHVLAVLGTGVQAASHLRYVTRTRSFDDIVVAGRDPGRAAGVAEAAAADLGRPVEVAGSFEAAVRAADVVCTTTNAEEPILRRDWLSAGTHVNSVGWVPSGREIDEETVRDAVVIVESRQSALAPGPAGTNDLIWPIRDGIVSDETAYAEIGEILAGNRPGRTSPEQITLYKAVGVAVEDAAAVGLVLRKARDRGLGRDVEI